MLNVKGQLEHLKLNMDSPLQSMQIVRDRINGAADPKKFAQEFIKQLVGLERKYEEPVVARMVAMGVVEQAVRLQGEISDPETFVLSQEARAKALRENKELAWMFVQAERDVQAENLQSIAGSEIKVAIKDNGKIKKGGKQVLATELYKTHVLNSTSKPLTNQEFIALLVKELGMSKSGATTYAYNVKRQLGEPSGGIEKSKRGKKAKAA